jgi:L-lactate dehydrogenase complex protein LldG
MEAAHMYEQFKARAVGVGAEVYHFGTRKHALDFILPFLRQEGTADAPGCYAVWAESPFLDGLEREQWPECPGLSFQVTRELAAQAKIGISQMEWALADTGSLVQDQGAPEQRLVSSLTSIHIALVPSGNILEGKQALFKKINPSTSRYIAFITGPSRTADIERVLTIGVHGPGRLIIIFVDELGGANQ